jgi:hypothetical protein
MGEPIGADEGDGRRRDEDEDGAEEGTQDTHATTRDAT